MTGLHERFVLGLPLMDLPTFEKKDVQSPSRATRTPEQYKTIFDLDTFGMRTPRAQERRLHQQQPTALQLWTKSEATDEVG